MSPSTLILTFFYHYLKQYTLWYGLKLIFQLIEKQYILLVQLSRISITDAFNRDQNTQINQITFSLIKIISCRIKLVYSGGLGIQLSRLLTLSHKFQRFLGSISEAFHVDELWHSFTKLFLRRDKILLYRRHLAISSLGIFFIVTTGIRF